MANGNLTLTLTDAGWRVVQEPLDPKAAGAVLVRETPNMDATVMKGLMSTQLSTLTVTDPVADGQTYTGLWVLSKPEAIPTEGDDRRWFSLRQTLTKVTNATTQETLPTSYIDQDGMDVLNVFQLEEGITDHIARSWLFLNPAQQTTILGLTITPPSGYVEKQRKVIIEEAGNRTMTLTILFRKVTWPNTVTTGIPARQYQTGESGHNSINEMGKRKTESAPGVPIANAVTVVETLAPNDTDWATEHISSQDGGNGEAVITRIRRKINTTKIADGDAVIEVERWGAATSTTATLREVTRFWPNMTEAAATTLIAALTATWTHSSGVVLVKDEVRRIRDPDTGLVTVSETGSNPTFGYRYSHGEIDIATFEQYFVYATDGVTNAMYRVTVGLRITKTWATAYAWANDSSLKPQLNREDVQYSAPMSGKIKYSLDHQMWHAYKYTYVVANAPYNVFGD